MMKFIFFLMKAAKYATYSYTRTLYWTLALTQSNHKYSHAKVINCYTNFVYQMQILQFQYPHSKQVLIVVSHRRDLPISSHSTLFHRQSQALTLRFRSLALHDNHIDLNIITVANKIISVSVIDFTANKGNPQRKHSRQQWKSSQKYHSFY